MFSPMTLSLFFVGIFLAQARSKEEYPHAVGYRAPEGEGEDSYCQRRPGEQCCPGRNDKCTMPFLDTMCYCDIFCNRTMTDCCPDFWGFCMGIEPPPGLEKKKSPLEVGEKQPGLEKKKSPLELGEKKPTIIANNCYHYGLLYNPGDEIKANCNNCTCVNAIIQEEFNWKCTQKICVVRWKLLNFVNSDENKNSWKALNYSMFWGLSLNESITYWLGTHQPTTLVTEMSIVKVYPREDLPEQFDSRKEWPGLISPVLNQNSCASSWAFSTAGVASDRLSIHSNGVYKGHTLSPQHLISCNTDHSQHGCNSGHIDRAWWFIRKVGVVDLACYPYTSGKTNTKNSCALPRSYITLKESTCPSDGSKATVFQASPPYRVAANEKEIMTELTENGPVQAVIEVKEDFFLYKSGVYHHTLSKDHFPPTLKDSHFHSVRLVGWGTDYSTGKPIKYWLCANSWGPEWGEDGYFRIQRGTDESRIESYVVGAWIKVNERMLIKKRKHPVKHADHLNKKHDNENY